MLEVHHIIYRSHGGPDEEWNLITLCKEHHMAAHNNDIAKEELFILNAWGQTLGTLKTLKRKPECRRLCVTCAYGRTIGTDGKIKCAKGFEGTTLYTYCELWEEW